MARTMAGNRMWRAAALAAMAALTLAGTPVFAQHSPRERPLLQRPGGDRDGSSWSRDNREADRLSRPDLRNEGGGRLSREERQQLRRDIGDAGRDLYRREPQRRR